MIDAFFSPTVSIEQAEQHGPSKRWVVIYYDGETSPTGYVKKTLPGPTFKTKRLAARAAWTLAAGKGWSVDKDIYPLIGRHD